MVRGRPHAGQALPLPVLQHPGCPLCQPGLPSPQGASGVRGLLCRPPTCPLPVAGPLPGVGPVWRAGCARAQASPGRGMPYLLAAHGSVKGVSLLIPWSLQSSQLPAQARPELSMQPGCPLPAGGGQAACSVAGGWAGGGHRSRGRLSSLTQPREGAPTPSGATTVIWGTAGSRTASSRKAP